MEEVYSWVRGIIILYLLLKIFLYLVSDSRYYRYMHFFARVLVLLAIVRPLLAVGWSEEALLNRIGQLEFDSELGDIKTQASAFGEMQEADLSELYDRAVMESAQTVAMEYGFVIRQLHAQVDEEGSLAALDMTICEQRADSGITIGDIVIDANEDEDTYEYVYEDFRKKMAERCQISEKQIKITLRKD